MEAECPEISTADACLGGSRSTQAGGQGQLCVAGRRWEISRALAGEWVKLVRLEERIRVYYCRSLVRELDLSDPDDLAENV